MGMLATPHGERVEAFEDGSEGCRAVVRMPGGVDVSTREHTFPSLPLGRRGESRAH